MFQHCGQHLVDAAFKGRDDCLFAYGHTGAGKTFSMRGGGSGAVLDGLVQRAADEKSSAVPRRRARRARREAACVLVSNQPLCYYFLLFKS